MIHSTADGYITSDIFPNSVGLGFGTQQSKSLKDLFPDNKLIEMRQVHGDLIRIFSKDGLDGLLECDGLITKSPGFILTVKTADCIPLLFYDETTKIIGAVHAGWKGSLYRISEKMIAQLVQLGAKKEHIKVAIGPGIGACCYGVYGERLSLFQTEFPRWPDIISKNNNENTLNLLRLNYLQLLNAGVDRENIDYFPFCTKCDSGRFYSYNKDKTDKRMQSYIMLL